MATSKKYKCTGTIRETMAAHNSRKLRGEFFVSNDFRQVLSPPPHLLIIIQPRQKMSVIPLLPSKNPSKKWHAEKLVYDI